MEKNDMTKGPITGKLLRFFFPVLFGMLFQQLYNTVDAIIVGNCVGPAALAAVGGSPAVIINLVIGFFTGLASGATVIISQYFGSQDEEQLSRAEHTVITFSFLTGAVLTVLYLTFIVYMTLMYRAEGESRARFELFWSYRQFFDSAILRLEILNNIWLFIPMGAMLSQFMRGWKAVLCALLCSAAVEIVQYYTGLGLCELDDVVSNTLGAATGAVLAAGINRIRHRKQPGLEKA